MAGPDAGIELAWVDGAKIYHNTVWRADERGRGIRCIEKIYHLDLANNLVRGAILPTGGETTRSNITGTLEGWFMQRLATCD